LKNHGHFTVQRSPAWTTAVYLLIILAISTAYKTTKQAYLINTYF